jgi:hypothetical protein
LVVGTVLTPKFGTENRIINKLWKWILVTLYSLVLVWQNYTDCLLMNRRGRVRGGGGHGRKTDRKWNRQWPWIIKKHFWSNVTQLVNPLRLDWYLIKQIYFRSCSDQ